MVARLWAADNWQASDGGKYAGRTIRQLIGVLLSGGAAARPLGARSGVAPGTATSGGSATVTASSTTVTVKPHGGALDLQQSSIAGPYLYTFDQNVTRPLTPANANNPRVDLVSVQVSDPAESDGTSAPGVDIVYTTGTASAAPAAPAAPDRSLVLAQINVPAQGGGSPTVTWVAPFTAAAGGIVPASGASAYPSAPYVGQYIDDAALGLLRWDGDSWESYGKGGDTGWKDIPTVNSGYNVGVAQFRIKNGDLRFRISVNRGSGQLVKDETVFNLGVALPTSAYRVPFVSSHPVSGFLALSAAGVATIAEFNASGTTSIVATSGPLALD